MTPSRLPDWPRLLRGTMAAAYVGMTSAQFDRAVASGEIPDPSSPDFGGKYAALLGHRLGGATVLRWEAKNNRARH